MLVIRRTPRLLAVLIALFGTIALALSLATPASATPSDGFSIRVERACFLEYGGQEALIGASAQDLSNANSWYCKRKVGDSSSTSISVSTDKSASFEASVGGEWTIVGDVDMQLYCSTEHPGTTAVVSDNYAPWLNAYNWLCQ